MKIARKDIGLEKNSLNGIPNEIVIYMYIKFISGKSPWIFCKKEYNYNTKFISNFLAITYSMFNSTITTKAIVSMRVNFIM